MDKKINSILENAKEYINFLDKRDVLRSMAETLHIYYSDLLEVGFSEDIASFLVAELQTLIMSGDFEYED